MGLLSTRDFLNALAFRVFHSTQYIRHASVPDYTPEPDVCHELLGHVPLLADPAFARFSHELGLASLGANEEDLTKIGTLYWFTVEFGLCRQNGVLRAYGAGLLSSFGELQHSLTSKPEKKPLDVAVASTSKYIVTEYQMLYYVADSFEKATEQFTQFMNSMERPFSIRYNPYTESVEVLDTDEKIMDLAQEIKFNSDLLAHALRNKNRSKSNQQ